MDGNLQPQGGCVVIIIITEAKYYCHAHPTISLRLRSLLCQQLFARTTLAAHDRPAKSSRRPGSPSQMNAPLPEPFPCHSSTASAARAPLLADHTVSCVARAVPAGLDTGVRLHHRHSGKWRRQHRSRHHAQFRAQWLVSL